MNELELMREQLKSMKKRLEETRIVNRELLLKMIRKETSWLNNIFRLEIISTPVFLLIILTQVLLSGMSIWFFITVLIGVIIDIALDYSTMRISQRDMTSLSLVSLRAKLIRQKKQRFWQNVIGFPLGIFWGIWFIIEFMNWIFEDGFLPVQAYYPVIYVAVALFILVVGIVFFLLYRKMQRTNDDIIEQIERIKSED